MKKKAPNTHYKAVEKSLGSLLRDWGHKVLSLGSSYTCVREQRLSLELLSHWMTAEPMATKQFTAIKLVKEMALLRLGKCNVFELHQTNRK